MLFQDGLVFLYFTIKIHDIICASALIKKIIINERERGGGKGNG